MFVAVPKFGPTILLIFPVLCFQNKVYFYLWAGDGVAVSIVSDYGLDDKAIEVRSPAEEKEFFLYPLCPDRLWDPPSLLSNGYRGSFPRGVKRGQGVTLTIHPI
jgi:hypothetical protein